MGSATQMVEPLKTIDAAGSTGNRRLLVVDDNKDAADTMAMLMETFGYEVRSAYDLASAIREAAAFAPHVALLDLSQPEPDGIEVARRFQQMDETRKTVLIALSGYGQPDDVARTRKAGFIHHLVKPADPMVIHNLIESMKLTGD
jgi:two-component system, chemotaxis family, CheB/CheR fusion protein